MPKGGHVYIMTNRNFGTLYVGVTSDLSQRVWQHRNGEGSAFCHEHKLTRLVYVEHHNDIESAILREKRIKNGSELGSFGWYAGQTWSGRICMTR